MTSSNEEMGSGTDEGTIEVSPGEPFGGDPDCAHAEEVQMGEGHDWDEDIQMYRVSLLMRCTTCGAERLDQTTEEVPA